MEVKINFKNVKIEKVFFNLNQTKLNLSDGNKNGEVYLKSRKNNIYFGTIEIIEFAKIFNLYKIDPTINTISFVQSLKIDLPFGTARFYFFHDDYIISVTYILIKIINIKYEEVHSYQIQHKEIISDQQNGANFAYIDKSDLVIYIFKVKRL